MDGFDLDWMTLVWRYLFFLLWILWGWYERFTWTRNYFNRVCVNI